MGQTVSSLCESYTPSSCTVPKYKLLICGIGGAGKTSVLYRFALPEQEEMIDAIPTIGFNVERFRADAAELTAWDLGGRDKTRALWKHYYEGTDAIVYVVDSNDRGYMMEAARDEFHRISHEKELKEFPVLLLCNKQDLPSAMTPQEIVQFFGLNGRTTTATRQRPILVQGCSAKTNAGMDEGINRLADCLLELKSSDGSSSDSGVKLVNPPVDDDSIQITSTVSASSISSSTDVSALSSKKKNRTLQNFAPIQKSTQCPFAKAAKLWGGIVSSSSETPSTIEEQASSHVPSLVEFCKRVAADDNTKPLDGFCIEIDDKLAREGGPEEFGQCVRRMLLTISEQDPSRENKNVMKAKYIDRPGWRFRFHSIDFFVTTFAPCYPETSSRHGFGSDKAFILLQPETSFVRHKLPADSPETDWENPRNIREKTRVAYKNAGRPYHIPETTSYPMVEHIVKPICDDGKSVVRWWNPSR